jgi:beta-galactosidase
MPPSRPTHLPRADFNQRWLFGGRYTPGSEGPGFDDSGFAEVTLPHTVTPLSWGDWDPRAWEQLWIYRKHLAGPPSPRERVFVDFDGVMTNAIVYLGGVELCRHEGGYLPWSVELTPRLVSGNTVLAVVVDGRWREVPPGGDRRGARSVDYLQPAGIYRDVALRVAPEIFIADVFAKPTDVLSATPSVEIQVTIDAARVPGGPVNLTAELLDGPHLLGSAQTTVTTMTTTGTTLVTLSLTGITDVTRWSPDTPKLYDLRTTLTGAATHHHQTRTGFRHATFALDGFYLNGERLQIFGLNRHQLFPYIGMAAPRRLQRRDAELIKHELSCNMVRCSHYPQSPHFLDACDELGLMVWEEIPGWQYVGGDAFQEIVLENVRDMVVRDRNRPSVIVWGTRVNESAHHPSLYTRTRELAYALDGSRQTTGAMTSRSTKGWTEDVFAYDDYHSSGGDAVLEPPLEDVPYLVSEAVGALSGAPLYRWLDGEGTLALQARMHAQVHSVARSNPHYAGLLGWAGIDYASLNGRGRTWRHLKWPGVLDTFRIPKPGAALYRSQIDPAIRPVILPLFPWDGSPPSRPGPPSRPNRPNRHGPPSPRGPKAIIATNCDRLELYLGDAHVGTGIPDLKDFPHLAHPPAQLDLSAVAASGAQTDLRIDGYVGGELVSSIHLSADRARDRLALVVEDSEIQGDGSDMTRIIFYAVDAYGNQRPDYKGEVTLALDGPATLIAQNPFAFATYGGVGGAFVRSQEPGRYGTVTVTATHPTLGHADGTITITPTSAGT